MPAKIQFIDDKEYEHSFVIASQIIEKIINLMDEGVDISTIPPSAIPTITLFNLASCYGSLYNKMINDGLIKSGNISKSKNIH